MQACGSTRPRVHDPAWVCNGSDLVTVIPATETMPPVVVRRDLLGYVDDATDCFLAVHPWTPFDGGDHLHLCLPQAGER